MTAISLQDGLLAVRSAPTGDVTQAVTTLIGWMDLSRGAVSMLLEESREIVERRQFGENPRPRVLGGGVTTEVTFIITNNASNDAALRRIQDAGGRFNFVVQYDRTALEYGDQIIPAPSAENPQHAGSAMIMRLRPFSAEGRDDISELLITAALDKDYEVYP